jgi:hypothetical protein
MLPIPTIVPNALDLLALELEELAGVLLVGAFVISTAVQRECLNLPPLK